MKTIKEGIVFSNDIERILRGCNALNFDYTKKGIIIPSSDFINDLRNDFKMDVRRIFTNVVIISEEEMDSGMSDAILDIYGRYPHCIFG